MRLAARIFDSQEERMNGVSAWLADSMDLSLYLLASPSIDTAGLLTLFWLSLFLRKGRTLRKSPLLFMIACIACAFHFLDRTLSYYLLSRDHFPLFNPSFSSIEISTELLRAPFLLFSIRRFRRILWRQVFIL
jgi:hypothetical protein